MLGAFLLCVWVNNVPNINKFWAAKRPNIKKFRGSRGPGRGARGSNLANSLEIIYVYGLLAFFFASINVALAAGIGRDLPDHLPSVSPSATVFRQWISCLESVCVCVCGCPNLLFLVFFLISMFFLQGLPCFFDRLSLLSQEF